MICSIDGCDKVVTARGWCKMHYCRWAAHGDPTICLKPKSKHGSLLQWIEDNANVTSDECLIWPFARHTSGYAKITGGTAIRVMCERAHGAPPTPKHQASHSCGRGKLGCISPVHLRWATVKQNHSDKILHGTQIRGAENYNAKLTEDRVREIRSLRGTISVSQMAKRFGVSFGCISSIYYGQSWKWLA